jgi:hypothetical protein
MKIESKFDPTQQVRIKGTPELAVIIAVVIGPRNLISYDLITPDGRTGTIKEDELELES